MRDIMATIKLITLLLTVVAFIYTQYTDIWTINFTLQITVTTILIALNILLNGRKNTANNILFAAPFVIFGVVIGSFLKYAFDYTNDLQASPLTIAINFIDTVFIINICLSRFTYIDVLNLPFSKDFKNHIIITRSLYEKAIPIFTRMRWHSDQLPPPPDIIGYFQYKIFRASIYCKLIPALFLHIYNEAVQIENIIENRRRHFK